MPKIYFSPKVTIICTLLILGMLRLSYWQWQRHGEKELYIKELSTRIQTPITPLSESVQLINTIPEKILFRRFSFTGTFDYSHEIILRNRKLGEMPGFYLITPLHLANNQGTVLVSRGFLPLAFNSATDIKRFHGSESFTGIGLAKLTSSASFLAPQDPDPKPGEWFGEWLRVDIQKISKQLPYPLLPIYLELLDSQAPPDIDKEVISTGSTRDDIFFMPNQKHLPSREDAIKLNLTAPVPVISTIIPPSRHLGYVFEWAIMALMTGLIGLVLQLRKPRAASVKCD